VLHVSRATRELDQVGVDRANLNETRRLPGNLSQMHGAHWDNHWAAHG
jgi:hypothetical protein